MVTTGNLSRRGEKNRDMMNEKVQKAMSVFRNLYDEKTNPEGIVSFGVADNSLLRPELLQYFNHNRLSLSPGELTYGDRIFTSARLLEALCHLFNDIPDGIPSEIPTPSNPFGGSPPKNIHPIKPEQIVVGTGASGILDSLFWTLCNEGDGILLSTPYYNGFDGDSGIRSGAKIVEVKVPQPNTKGNQEYLDERNIEFYEKAIEKAKEDGIECKVLLICNPHNPTGGIYSREALISFAKFASKHNLHLLMDEIYARSIFSSSDTPKPETFHSILTIDVKKEANLDISRVHVVTSASKDFSVNGFRLGVAVIQDNKELVRAMSALGILNQASSPASALWYTWLNDTKFLAWYLEENRRRLSLSYTHTTDFMKHHQIPYVPSGSGHFFLVDLSKFLDPKVEDQREAEALLAGKLMEEKVFLAPGAQYHHPTPGWFRFTFTTSPSAIKVGLTRMEKVLGLESWSEKRELLDLQKGMKDCPVKYDEKVQQVRTSMIKQSLDEKSLGVEELEKGEERNENENGNGKSKDGLLKRLSCGML